MVVVVPLHKVESKADKIPAIGACVTSIRIESFASVPKHAPVPDTVYTIYALPALSALINPDTELTVATVISELVHEPPPTVADIVVVDPLHKVESKADKIPASGV